MKIDPTLYSIDHPDNRAGNPTRFKSVLNNGRSVCVLAGKACGITDSIDAVVAYRSGNFSLAKRKAFYGAAKLAVTLSLVAAVTFAAYSAFLKSSVNPSSTIEQRTTQPNSLTTYAELPAQTQSRVENIWSTALRKLRDDGTTGDIYSKVEGCTEKGCLLYFHYFKMDKVENEQSSWYDRVSRYANDLINTNPTPTLNEASTVPQRFDHEFRIEKSSYSCFFEGDTTPEVKSSKELLSLCMGNGGFRSGNGNYHYEGELGFGIATYRTGTETVLSDIKDGINEDFTEGCRWIRKRVERLGGDPNAPTICGSPEYVNPMITDGNTL